MNGLSVIIPSKNVDNLLPCVEAVRRHEPGIQIFVIDDGLDHTKIHYGFGPNDPFCIPGMRPFIFARNVNLGIAAAGEDDVVMLNDDAILESPGGFTLMQESPTLYRGQLGLISATTNVAGNPEQHRRRKSGMRWLVGPTPGNTFPTVAFVCVFIPRRTINTVGLLDERFGGVTDEGKLIYGSEDNDYCRRVADAGLKIGIHDGCYVDHQRLKSTFRNQPFDLQAGRRIFMEKWGSEALKLNLGSGDHPLEGFVNLDMPEWKWSKPLPYADSSVTAITVSHSLMYAAEMFWPFIFGEMFRVLKKGGVVRITEDATNDPKSERFGGFKDAITLTSVEKVRDYLVRAGFKFVEPLGTESTHFKDRSLIQQWHGAPPKVFHIEGGK